MTSYNQQSTEVPTDANKYDLLPTNMRSDEILGSTADTVEFIIFIGIIIFIFYTRIVL